VFIDAANAENVAKSALSTLLVDRVELHNAVLSLGRYSDEIARSLKRGRVAARRIELMGGSQLRRLFLALVPRAEVTKRELRLYVSCYELTRFLAWRGEGLFTRAATRPTDVADRVHVVSAPVDLLCGKRTYLIPITPRGNRPSEPKPWLVDILTKAVDLRAFVLANRERSISELAKQKRMGPSQLSRFLRANYLAPDIQAAILDGTQPPTLTAWHILNGPLPMDWEQQRQLLGFT
jgi:hypothetical protein